MVRAALLLAPACRAVGLHLRPPAPAPPADPPDVALRAAAVAREQRLLALYDRALVARRGARGLALAARAGRARRPPGRAGPARPRAVTAPDGPAPAPRRGRAAGRPRRRPPLRTAQARARRLARPGRAAGLPGGRGGRARGGAGVSRLARPRCCRALLAAEHAAVYGYGVLGARLDDPRRTAALAGRRRPPRPARPLTAAAARTVPPRRRAAAGVRRRRPRPRPRLALAVRLEEGLAVRWRDLVGRHDDADLRRLGTPPLTATAVRAARWRAAAGGPRAAVTRRRCPASSPEARGLVRPGHGAARARARTPGHDLLAARPRRRSRRRSDRHRPRPVPPPRRARRTLPAAELERRLEAHLLIARMVPRPDRGRAARPLSARRPPRPPP